MIHCDLAVVGAGPGGCAAAVTAARRGLSVLLLHHPREGRPWPGESLPAGMDALVAAVFGDGVLNDGRNLRTFGNRSAWGGDELVQTDFVTNPLGGGWIVDRPRFDEILRARAVAAGVDLLSARARSIRPGESGWRLELADSTTVDASFVIDATGRAAALARRLAGGRRVSDQQIALIASFADEGDAYQGVTVESVSEGWWYTAPLPGHRRVLAYLTDADLWRNRVHHWRDLLGATRHIVRCAGPLGLSTIPHAYPAETAALQSLSGPRWLAAGDAAMTFDPMSSQGLTVAILMGSRAGDSVSTTLASGASAAIEAWAEDYRTIEGETRDLRIYYALQENRWPNSEFWRRRRSWPAAIA